jgi:hypothetical protein
MVTLTLVRRFARSPSKHCLQIWNTIGQKRGMVPPLHGKPERAVQLGQVVGTQALSLPLTESHTGDSMRALHFVGKRNGITPDMQPVGQRLKASSCLLVDELGGFQHNSSVQKSVPASDLLELLSNECFQCPM